MRRYETIFILRSDLGETQVKDSIKRFEGLVATGGGEMLETDEWGFRELAYRIHNERRGYYVRLDYAATGSVMNEVERNLINPDEVMRLPPTDLLVFSHGMPPYRGKKIIYYLDPRFKHSVNLPAPESREDLIQELPPRSGPQDPWCDLETKAITTSENPKSKKIGPSAGGSSPDLEQSQDITLDPEAFFPPDPFQSTPTEASGDSELVDTPFGAIRRGER